MTIPRIQPVELEEAPESVRDLLRGLVRERGQIPGVYRTLARSAAAFPHVIGLAESLWHGSTLDRQLQELVILRVAQLTGSDYEWGRHRRVATRVGVPETKVLALAQWTESEAFEEVERHCLAVAEAVVREVDAGPALEPVIERLGPESALELLLLTGFYVMIAGVLRSVAIPQEPGDEPLFERPPPPR